MTKSNSNHRSRISDSKQKKPFKPKFSSEKNGISKGSKNSHPDKADPKEERTDLVYGRHSVIALLESDRQINRLWLIPKIKKDSQFAELLQQAKKKGAFIDEVTNQRLDVLTNKSNHQGVVAQVAPYQYLPISDLINQANAQTKTPIILIADSIEDPHNLGAIVRTAEAFGVQGIIIPQRRAVGVTSTVIKVAAGALESIPIARVINLNKTIKQLQEAGFWIYGMAAESSKLLHKIDFPKAVVLVVGSEGSGLGSLVEKNCDELVAIPLKGKTPSLNASVATSIFIYEVCRQRQAKLV